MTDAEIAKLERLQAEIGDRLKRMDFHDDYMALFQLDKSTIKALLTALRVCGLAREWGEAEDAYSKAIKAENAFKGKRKSPEKTAAWTGRYETGRRALKARKAVLSALAAPEPETEEDER